jgi:hypothetical protein
MIQRIFEEKLLMFPTEGVSVFQELLEMNDLVVYLGKTLLK